MRNSDRDDEKNLLSILRVFYLKPRRLGNEEYLAYPRWAFNIANGIVLLSILIAVAESIKNRSYYFYVFPFVVFLMSRVLIYKFVRLTPVETKKDSLTKIIIVIVTLILIAVTLLYLPQ
jgi:hypothetical protein